MKLLTTLLLIISQLSWGQIKAPSPNLGQKSGKQYSYRIQLNKISSTSYPGVELQLKLMQNAAIIDGDNMLAPIHKNNDTSMYSICPYLLYGYKLSTFGSVTNCTTKERSAFIFKDSGVSNLFLNLKVPVDKITHESKLYFGIYGAEIMLPNNVKKKLTKANIRSFRLSDFDHSVRNYIKYDVNIDGVTITFDYIVERATVKK